jgi:hypothetical protein
MANGDRRGGHAAFVEYNYTDSELRREAASECDPNP